jgi:hypothetical protein
MKIESSEIYIAPVLMNKQEKVLIEQSVQRRQNENLVHEILYLYNSSGKLIESRIYKLNELV